MKELFKQYLKEVGLADSTILTYSRALNRANILFKTDIYECDDDEFNNHWCDVHQGVSPAHVSLRNMGSGSGMAAFNHMQRLRQSTFGHEVAERPDPIMALANKPEPVATPEPIIVEPTPVVEESELSKELQLLIDPYENFRDLFIKFNRAVADYTGYKFDNMKDMCDHFHQSNDPYCKYFRLLSIKNGRNLWAYPTRIELGEIENIQVSMLYQIIILKELMDANQIDKNKYEI